MPFQHRGGAVDKTSGFAPKPEMEIHLSPMSRLVLVSEGLINQIGGNDPVAEILVRLRKNEPMDSLNELVFQVKSKLGSSDEMPARDCTAVVFDADSQIVQISKPERDVT